jgi:hypothetical protein
MRNCIFYILTLVLFSSCFEPDEILPLMPNELVTIETDLVQKQATFIDLQDLNPSTSQVFKDWQLKFQNDANGWAIYLNTLSKVAVYNTRTTNFDSITSSYSQDNITWHLDIPTLSGAYPAIGMWGDFSFSAPQSYKDVYLVQWIHDGVTEISKLQILDAREGAYQIKYGSLDGQYVNSEWIEKSSNRQHSYFSLAENKVLPNAEPPQDEWTICFTYLTDSVIKHANSPYVATVNQDYGIYQGLIINRVTSTVFVDTVRSLDEINYFNSNNLEFNSIDELYNVFSKWDATTQSLVVNEKIIVIVKFKDNLCAIKPIVLERTPLSSFILQLKVKRL